MSNQLTEREVLQQLNIPDFRYITKVVLVYNYGHGKLNIL